MTTTTQTTTPEATDLDAVTARSAATVEALGTEREHAALSASADDVPTLVAEIEDLRAKVAAARDLAQMWAREARERGEDGDKIFTGGAAHMLLHRLGEPTA